MLAFFIVLAVILAVALVLQVRKNRRSEKYSDFWFTKWMESIEEHINISTQYDDLVKGYNALEEGSDEIEQNYQQEILSLHDQLEVIANSAEYWKVIAEELEQIRLDHDVNCLPVLGKDFYPNAEEEDTPLFDSMSG